MKVGNLWRSRYDELLKENKRLKEINITLKSQLIVTVITLTVIFIYSLTKSIY